MTTDPKTDQQLKDLEIQLKRVQIAEAKNSRAKLWASIALPLVIALFGILQTLNTERLIDDRKAVDNQMQLVELGWQDLTSGDVHQVESAVAMLSAIHQELPAHKRSDVVAKVIEAARSELSLSGYLLKIWYFENDRESVKDFERVSKAISRSLSAKTKPKKMGRCEDLGTKSIYTHEIRYQGEERLSARKLKFTIEQSIENMNVRLREIGNDHNREISLILRGCSSQGQAGETGST
jgi:hypothetical protein